MPTDYKLIKNNLKKVMNDYDKQATVQDLMASKLLIELSKISTDFENILELGSGTGLLTKRIAKNLHFKLFTANDLIEKSKFYVQKAIPNANFICGNALKIKPSKKWI